MKVHNEFSVPLPPADAWAMLNDIPRVARCAPGAELIEQKNDRNFKGTVAVALGPVRLHFKGDVVYKEVDADGYRVVADASGTETKARGNAHATVTFALQPTDGGTRVVVDTDVQLAGSIAQYGRGAALIQNTAQVIMDQFAKNFAADVARGDEGPGETAKPISGLKVLAQGIGRTVRG